MTFPGACVRFGPLCLMGLLICLMTAAAVAADTVVSQQRSVTQLAPGIYEVRHKDAPDHFPEGNTVVVIGQRGVMVVDSGYLPSTAREDIAQVRQWTDKPVLYLLNTHWHGDHTQGNETYAEAFPSITIIAHVETARMIGLRVPVYLSGYSHRIEEFQRQLDSGKDPSGTPLSEDQKEDLRTAIAGGKAASDKISSEFVKTRARVPDLTFEHELTIDLGGRKVELKHLGPGNTAGDVIAYLPQEKILIAGDLVDSPVPFLGSGFPIQQVATLKKMNALDYQTLVPGHGDVLKGKAFVEKEIQFIDEVAKAMGNELARSLNPATSDPRATVERLQQLVEKEVDIKKWRQTFAGDNSGNQEFFDGFTWPGLIEALHSEMWPR